MGIKNYFKRLKAKRIERLKEERKGVALMCLRHKLRKGCPKYQFVTGELSHVCHYRGKLSCRICDMDCVEMDKMISDYVKEHNVD